MAPSYMKDTAGECKPLPQPTPTPQPYPPTLHLHPLPPTPPLTHTHKCKWVPPSQMQVNIPHFLKII